MLLYRVICFVQFSHLHPKNLHIVYNVMMLGSKAHEVTLKI